LKARGPSEWYFFIWVIGGGDALWALVMVDFGEPLCALEFKGHWSAARLPDGAAKVFEETGE
jgi:hypothetical protein